MKNKDKKRKNDKNIKVRSLLIVLSMGLVGLVTSVLTFNGVFHHQIMLCLFLGFGLIFTGYNRKLKSSHDKRISMFDFIDQFILSLSVHKTMINALASVYEISDKTIKKELDSFLDGEGLEKIEYLAQYFNHPMYEGFLDIIRLYLIEGGNIVNSSSILMKEIAEERSFLMRTNHLHQVKLVELVISWLFVFLVVIMLRLSVSEMYQNLLKSDFFVIGLFVFFILILLSITFHSHVSFSIYQLEKKGAKNKQLETKDFVETFTFFRMGLHGGTNVFVALDKVATNTRGPIVDELLILTSTLKTNVSVLPFITFAENFREPLVKHILINIYQLMVNGGDASILFEFNYLFDRLNEINSESSYRAITKRYENIAQIPMVGTGLLVILIMAGVISILGMYMYV